MTEVQYITLILGFVANIVTVLIALLINNGRFNDQGNRLNDLKETLRAEIKVSESATRASESVLLAQMATYQMDIISKIAELDNRITRLER